MVELETWRQILEETAKIISVPSGKMRSETNINRLMYYLMLIEMNFEKRDLLFWSLHVGEQGCEKRGTWCGTTISSVFGLCAFLRPPNSAMIGHNIWRFITSGVHRSHYEEGPEKNLPFSVEKKWRLLEMTLYFGAEFAATFFTVRHKLTKK